MLQKRVIYYLCIRISNRAEYHEPTNILFINSHDLKFRDLGAFKTVQLMYKVKKHVAARLYPEVVPT